ncbi:FUSC family protein [Micropruina sp.]|uniref:FUSC family protein n=1 Tax=Micropruina sp. TaxID=2737536 RepID=UPI0039E31508
MTDPDHETPARRPAAVLAANVSSLAEDAWNRLDFRRRMLLFGLHLRQGLRRMRGSLVPVLVASMAAWIAYVVAHDLLGHPTPFFAPVAAWICLGFTYNRVPRKVLEIGAGATIGVGLGELILTTLGAGGWQLALGLLIGALVARLLDRGDLFTIQAGVNAMVVIGMGTLGSEMTGAGPSRLIDALVGAGVALLLAVALPGDVLNRPRRYVGSLLTELAKVFSMLAAGLRVGNIEFLRDAHAQLRGVERLLDDAVTVWKSSAQIVSLNPTMRRHRAQIDELGRQLDLSTRAVHTAETLLRQCRGVVDEADPDPSIARIMDDTAATFIALAGSIRHWYPPWQARTRAKDLAADCAPELSLPSDWRHSALLSVMRSIAIDLLQLTGLSRDQARGYLPGTGAEASGLRVRGDEASGVWGSDELPSLDTQPEEDVSD